MEAGLTPNTVREDSPVSYKGWSPKNYDHGYRGAITLRDALALSLNTVAVKLAIEVGPKAVVQAAQKLGHQFAAPAGAVAGARHLGGHAARDW